MLKNFYSQVIKNVYERVVISVHLIGRNRRILIEFLVTIGFRQESALSLYLVNLAMDLVTFAMDKLLKELLDKASWCFANDIFTAKEIKKSASRKLEK